MRLLNALAHFGETQSSQNTHGIPEQLTLTKERINYRSGVVAHSKLYYLLVIRDSQVLAKLGAIYSAFAAFKMAALSG